MSDKTLRRASPPIPKNSWRDVWLVYAEGTTPRLLFLGFSAARHCCRFRTLSFWLRKSCIDRKFTIGYLSWVGLAYGFKMGLGPLVDRLPIPLLTRLLAPRRSCLLLSQRSSWRRWVRLGLTDPKLALQPVVVRIGRGLRLGHPGHRAGRLSHRIGRHVAPGGAGSGLPDRLPHRDDSASAPARCGSPRAPRSATPPPTSTAPGRSPTWPWPLHAAGHGDRAAVARAGGPRTAASRNAAEWLKTALVDLKPISCAATASRRC